MNSDCNLDRVERFMLGIISKLLLAFLVIACAGMVVMVIGLVVMFFGMMGDATCLYPTFREDCG